MTPVRVRCFPGNIEMLMQQLLNGLVSGSIYALFALGFNLVFGTMNIMNLAHGAVFMTGAFVGVLTVNLGGPFPLALLAAMLAGGVLSVAIDFVAFRPLRRRHAGEFAALVASIGVNLALLNIMQALSKTQFYRFPPKTFPSGIVHFLGFRITWLQMTIVALMIVLVVLLIAYLYYTSVGRQIRAVAYSERTAMLLGVDPGKAYFQTFFLSGVLAGAAGVLIGLVFNSVHFMMGEPQMLKAFVVLVLGGLGSLPGAVVAGLILGVLQTLTAVYLPVGLGDIVVYSLLFAVLLIYPNGIFGSKVRTHARVGRV
ncbi:branched-chain amino acid ABC transporter permease [Bosea sp. (in: a-proteobacteria)]|uniref:branched-chain amino acid ABC transporter permease n=1 Tax=Bosea sp. (in: a-proteobacteria) TaxID=1871050 RepID=UPI0026131DB0|nr:branched-chain amino acid ABC transporter permease [Bosea sp. (in: a-proteobacteria)]MCO5091227.1 branched-chain amino acid ABC transporter permease [Bosea sp. (in: a-proteobacteria)]